MMNCRGFWLNRWRLVLFVCLGVFGIASPLLAVESEEKDVRAFGKSREESYRDKVVVVKVGRNELSSRKAFKFFRRTLERVENEKAAAVVFELDTPGGLAHETIELMVDDLAVLSVPSFSYVNNEASSAGALIAVSTDKIYMSELSTIGSAAVVNGTGEEIEKVMRAKIEGHLGSVVRNVAEKKGHNYEVVEAMMMMDKEVDFEVTSVGKDELLNLTAQEAIADYKGKPLLAVGIVGSIEEILEKEGLGDKEVLEAEPTGFERFASWIERFGGLILLVGFAAGYIEMKTPGFGLGALLAVIAFGVFFFGNSVAGNLAGYEHVVIFVLGIGLVLLDVFILPGTFILGTVGALMAVGSLFFAMVDEVSWKSWQFEGASVNLGDALLNPAITLTWAFIGATVLFALMLRFFPEIPFFQRFLLPASLEKGTGMVTAEGTASRGSALSEENLKVGALGKAVTDLRPAGLANFGGTQVDVTADNAFVSEGAQLEIVSADSFRVVVKVVELA